ncbi:MAG: hypothetical protein Kow00124_27960 [Anaerolineae bacterium]
MLERLHEHINEELRVNTRTDTIFVITAIVFNFVMLAISSIQAGLAVDVGTRNTTTPRVVMSITMVVTVIVTGIAVVGLFTGRATRKKLTTGLLQMYKDAGIEQYYDDSLLTNYMRRYVMFTAIIGVLSITAIVIPLVILLTG